MFESSARIVVQGSINLDMVVAAASFPRLGESVFGKSMAHRLGGKGANQAVAIAKLGFGDTFTMSPREAAKAVRLLNVKQVIPMHFCGFDFLTGRPKELSALLMDIEDMVIYDVKPGDTVEIKVNKRSYADVKTH